MSGLNGHLGMEDFLLISLAALLALAKRGPHVEHTGRRSTPGEASGRDAMTPSTVRPAHVTSVTILDSYYFYIFIYLAKLAFLNKCNFNGLH